VRAPKLVVDDVATPQGHEVESARENRDRQRGGQQTTRGRGAQWWGRGRGCPADRDGIGQECDHPRDPQRDEGHEGHRVEREDRPVCVGQPGHVQGEVARQDDAGAPVSVAKSHDEHEEECSNADPPQNRVTQSNDVRRALSRGAPGD